MKINGSHRSIFLALFLSTVLFAQSYAAEKNLSLDLGPEEKISMKELRELQIQKTDFILFDARGKDAYNAGHIEGAALPLPHVYYQEKQLLSAGVISKPFDYEESLAEAMKEQPRSAVIVTYCNSNCKASANLLRQLQKLGFMNVRSMEEGYQSWEKAGYPSVIAAPQNSSS